ncbi:MAG: HAD hydrolase-like protein [Maritimibacter sp.]
MKTVFLDLDGTLTDPKPGITRSVIHALEALGMAAPEPDDLTWVIGPALIDSFARLGVADPEEAIRLYRERFSTVGLFENSVYSGINEALEALATRYRLCLATAKPREFAIRITEHFGLDRHLAAQFGPEMDGTRNDKGDLLAYALNELGLEAGDCVMVGDRHLDIDAAKMVEMPSIGVTWGYSAPGELDHATQLCSTPEALLHSIIDVLG